MTDDRQAAIAHPNDPVSETCVACGGLLSPPLREPWPTACPVCQDRYPPSLLKAAGDAFDYALRLRTGEVIRFETAEIHGAFATLRGTDHWVEDHGRSRLPYPCPRGLDVRVDDIVWCADAPNGS
jgi:hypothetical protein